jgi:nicotinate-nucleotide adenylyltransferase
VSSPRWGEVTALFGGAFDPPHAGHREAVAGLFRAPGVRRALILPTPASAQKPTHAPTEHRFEMARLAFAGLEAELCLAELERARRDPSRPTYTHDTLLELQPRYGQLACVIGTDQLGNLHTWHRFPELLTLAHWIVLLRKGQEVELSRLSGLLKPHGKDWLTRGGTTLALVPTEAPELSSTGIRESLARSGSAPAGSLTQGVEAYLKTHRLYGTSGASQ